MGLLLILIGIIFLFVTIGTYNKLIKIKNSMDKIKSDIRVCQKKANLLINKMINSSSVASQKERDAIDQVNSVHAKYTMIQALAEHYPELKSTSAYIQMNSKIQTLLDDIAKRQEAYNSKVEKYNTELGTFPNVIFATLLGFKKVDYIDQNNLDKAIDIGDIEDIDDIVIS